MSETTRKHGMLVCVDGSAESDAAVAWATREAIMRHVAYHTDARGGPRGYRLAGGSTVCGHARVAEGRAEALSTRPERRLAPTWVSPSHLKYAPRWFIPALCRH